MREWLEDLNATMRAVAIGTVVLFAAGAIWLGWAAVFSPKFADQQRHQFQRSQSHQDAVVQDLTDRCAELATTTEPVARKAIVVVIAQRSATEDLTQLQMSADVRACVANAQTEYINGGK